MEQTTSRAADYSLASPDALFRVWACDNQVYGPIGLATLSEWVREGRVLPDTWLYNESESKWCRAVNLKGLEFPSTASNPTPRSPGDSLGPIDPSDLRQFEVFASLTNEDLAGFIQLTEVLSAGPGDIILRQGEPGDALYFVLEGSVRARIIISNEEKVLGTIGAGEFFGEMAMFTQATRSADVVAEEHSRFVRFSSEALRRLIRQNPSAAAPILSSLASLMARRVYKADTQIRQEVISTFLWR